MSADTFTLCDLSRALAAGTLTSTQVTRSCLDEISARNPSLNAFITVSADEAMAQAREADAEIAAGRRRGPLHGVPVSIKDLIDVAGVPTTAASRTRTGHVAERDATIVRRLRDAGAVLIGKTNLHEFALGTTNEDSAFGPARHPIDPSRSPGGSSGGSAISVATPMAYASIGTDTGGSIRIPAAACGLVGLKPSYGEIPLDGVVPLSPTFDYVGPICRSVADASVVYGVLRGDPSPAAPERCPPHGLRLGLLRPYFMELLDPAVESAFDAACGRLRRSGVDLVEAAVAHAADMEAIYVHVVLPEAAAYHDRMLHERPGDYTPNVRMRIEMGRYLRAEDYVRARRGCEALRAEVDAAMDGCDALLLPALAIPAPRIGAPGVRIGGAELPARTIMLRLTQLFNATGHPAIALPCGSTPGGLPVSAQLVGRRGATPELLRVAAGVEPYLGPGMSR